MKKKDILTLLKKHPSGASIKIAMDWVANQRKHRGDVGAVLDRLMELPEFEPNLLWFARWLESAHRTVLKDSISMDLFNSTIKVLEKTVVYPDRGDILRIFLETFYDDRLIKVSRKWLLEFGMDGAFGSDVAALLLQHDRSNEFLAIANNLALKERSAKLVCALLEYTDGSQVIDVALEFLRTGISEPSSKIAAALLRNDAKFAEHVSGYVSHMNETDTGFHTTISLIARASLEGSEIIFDWIQHHNSSSQLPDFLISLYSARASEENIAYGWNWFLANEGNTSANQLLLSLLNARGSSPPSEIVDYAMRWARVHENHDLYKHFAFAIISAGNPQQKVTFGHYCLDDFEERNRGSVLRLMVQQSGDSESIRQAKQWLYANERDHDDEVIGSLISALMARSNDARLVALCKLRLAKASPSSEQIFIMPLLNVGDTEGIVAAKRYLLPHRLENRLLDDHVGNGEMIKRLLEVSSDDSVRQRASEWIQRQACPNNEALKVDLRLALETQH